MYPTIAIVPAAASIWVAGFSSNAKNNKKWSLAVVTAEESIIMVLMIRIPLISTGYLTATGALRYSYACAALARAVLRQGCCFEIFIRQ